MSQSDRVYRRSGRLSFAGSFSFLQDGSRWHSRRKRGEPGRGLCDTVNGSLRPFRIHGGSKASANRGLRQHRRASVVRILPRPSASPWSSFRRGPVRAQRREEGLAFLSRENFCRGRARSLAREITGEGFNNHATGRSLCRVQSELICFINWGRSVCLANFRWGRPARGTFRIWAPIRGREIKVGRRGACTYDAGLCFRFLPLFFF